MKLRKGLTLKTICGENVIVAEGLENIDFGKMIVLNETARYLFEAVNGREFTEDELVGLLLEKYEVDSSIVKNDVISLCRKWSEAGLLEA